MYLSSEYFEVREEETAFADCIFVAVGAVDGVCVDGLGKAVADGAGGCFLRVGGTDEFAEGSDCVVTFEDGRETRAAGHEFDDVLEEWAFAVDGVELTSGFVGEVDHFHGFDCEASLDDLVEDFAGVSVGHCVGLDDRECDIAAHINDIMSG